MHKENLYVCINFKIPRKIQEKKCIFQQSSGLNFKHFLFGVYHGATLQTTGPSRQAKCDLFFHYRDTKEISFYYFRDIKVCGKHEKNTHEFHLYCWDDHVCKVNE